MQDTAENVVYAIVGPFSSCQSRTLETLKLDEDRVEYAKINYSIMPQNPTHASSDKKATDEGITITLTLSPMACNIEKLGMGLGIMEVSY